METDQQRQLKSSRDYAKTVHKAHIGQIPGWHASASRGKGKSLRLAERAPLRGAKPCSEFTKLDKNAGNQTDIQPLW